MLLLSLNEGINSEQDTLTKAEPSQYSRASMGCSTSPKGQAIEVLEL
jgi:hypothetical protein